MLEEFAAIDHAAERSRIENFVIDAVSRPGAWRAWCTTPELDVGIVSSSCRDRSSCPPPRARTAPTSSRAAGGSALRPHSTSGPAPASARRHPEIDADARQLDVRRLRAERIGLAIELLAEEIELAADRIVRPGVLSRLGLAMCAVSRSSSSRTRPCDSKRHFLGEALFRQRRGALQQLGELALEARAHGADLRLGAPGRGALHRPRSRRLAVDHLASALPSAARAATSASAPPPSGGDRCPMREGSRRFPPFILFLDDAAHAQQAVRRRRRGAGAFAHLLDQASQIGPARPD